MYARWFHEYQLFARKTRPAGGMGKIFLKRVQEMKVGVDLSPFRPTRPNSLSNCAYIVKSHAKRDESTLKGGDGGLSEPIAQP